MNAHLGYFNFFAVTVFHVVWEVPFSHLHISEMHDVLQLFQCYSFVGMQNHDGSCNHCWRFDELRCKHCWTAFWIDLHIIHTLHFPRITQTLSNAPWLSSLPLPPCIWTLGALSDMQKLEHGGLSLTPGMKVDVFCIPWVLPPACCTTGWRPNRSGAGWRWRSPRRAERWSKRWQRPWNHLNHRNIPFRPLLQPHK